MKTKIKVVPIDENGKNVYLTKIELEKMLNEIYEDGYKDGYEAGKSYINYTPTWTTTPYLMNNDNITIKSDDLKPTTITLDSIKGVLINGTNNNTK